MNPPAGSRKKSRSHGKRKGHPSSGKKSAKRAKIECPECKGLVAKDAKECPLCGASLPEPKIIEEKPSEAPPPLEGEGEKPIPETSEAPLEQAEPAPAETAVEPATTEAEVQPPQVKVEEPSPETEVVSATKVEKEPSPEMRACPVCGTVASVSFDKCPMCSTSFLGTTEPQMPVEPARPAKVVRKRKLAAAPAAESPGTRSTKKRKLKTAKVTPAPAEVRKGSEGFTNGLGHVNGLARARTDGQQKSDSFVNGTGVSDDLGKKDGTPGRRPTVLRRWQFLAVFVVVILIISTFVLLSYSDDRGKFSVDGDFSDWNSATTYGVESESAAPSSNIIEWAVGNDGKELFLYFKTEANTMSSAYAESYYLFVDSDGSNKTGYAMEPIGADYLLQITGWDSEVRSASLLIYPESADRYNWGAWTSAESLSCSRDGTRLEAGASLSEALSDSAMFFLVSKDSAERGAVSHVAPMSGSVLIVHQAPSADILATGTVEASPDVPLLELTFTCDGAGGKVDQITPTLDGASLAGQVQGFSLGKGQEYVATISVDTTGTATGDLISGELLASGIASNFDSVRVVGVGARAYAVAAPSAIVVDGAFADWDGRLSVDQDLIPVTEPNIDIDKVGNVSNASESFFFVSVEGEICSGSFVPAVVAKPSGGGGGTVVPSRRTAEDVLNVYIDSDRLASTGMTVSLDSKVIGADHKIEIKGMLGQITSAKEFIYSLSPRGWIETPSAVTAAKDDHRIEMSVGAASLGGSSSIDFIIETTSWKERADLAIFDPSSAGASSRHWIVVPDTSSPYATSMSYQRKLFWDGTNHWSFFFDGRDTSFRFSADDGVTWTPVGRVFATAGVNETSIWYDPGTSTVYAVGDTSDATLRVLVQSGIVDPSAHKIAWAARDYVLNVSSYAQGGKNAYISKDVSGYLWVLSGNRTQGAPDMYQLSAFRSVKLNSTGSWIHTGQMFAAATNVDNSKGSIVPAGKGSDVWAVYGYGGNVAARKFTGTWQPPYVIYAQMGSKANTDNAPPSVVVDDSGVVHVVYGNGRRSGPASTPSIEYSHNLTGSTQFTLGENLDPLVIIGVGDYYPTITLERSTGDLYALWLQSDAAQVPRNVVCKQRVSGIWSDKTIVPQTTFAKLFLTSAYSVSGPYMVGWQWTQNATSPIDVLYDSTQIPEFGGLALPIVLFMAAVALCGWRRAARRL